MNDFTACTLRALIIGLLPDCLDFQVLEMGVYSTMAFRWFLVEHFVFYDCFMIVLLSQMDWTEVKILKCFNKIDSNWVPGNSILEPNEKSRMFELTKLRHMLRSKELLPHLRKFIWNKSEGKTIKKGPLGNMGFLSQRTWSLKGAHFTLLLLKFLSYLKSSWEGGAILLFFW